MSLLAMALNTLQEKKGLFLQYEGLTQSMLNCDVSELPSIFEQRQKLIEGLDHLDQEIQQIAACDQAYAQLPAAVRNSCNRADLSSELQMIFDRAQEIFTIMNRLRQHEDGVKQRLEANQAELIALIKAGHQTSQILKYRHGIHPKLSEGSLLSIHNRNA